MNTETQKNNKNPSSPYAYTEKKLANAQVELSIVIPKDIIQKKHKEILKELGKEAQIKGFRKGNIPESVLVSKFSDYIQAKSFDSIANEAFTAVIPSLKYPPLSYSSPKPVNFDEKTSIDPNEDFTFTVIYDRYPDIELANIDTLTLTTYKIQIDEEDMNTELKKYQEQNAFSVEKQGGAEENNIIIGSYIELDKENKPIENTRNEEYTITLGVNTSPKEKSISDALIGINVSEKKHIQQESSNDIEITVKRIQERKIPEVNDELAQDINEKYKTVDDLKADITNQLQDRANSMQISEKQNTITEYLRKESSIEIPQSAVQLQLDNTLKHFAQQSGTDLDSLLSTIQKTKEELSEIWREDAIRQVQEHFIVAKIIENEGIKTSIEDVKKILRKETEKSNSNADEIIEYYKKNNLMQQLQYEEDTKQAFESLIKKCKEETGASLSLHAYTELQQKQEQEKQKVKIEEQKKVE